MLWLGTGAAHPPRRALIHLAAMVGALALPLLYEGTSAEIVEDMAAEALILVAIGGAADRLPGGRPAPARRPRGGRRGRAPARAGGRAHRARQPARVRRGAHRGDASGPRASGRRSASALVDVDNLAAHQRPLRPPGGRPPPRRGRPHDGAGSVRGSDRCFRWGGDEFVGGDAGHRPRGGRGRCSSAMAETVDARPARPRTAAPIGLTWGVAELEPGGERGGPARRGGRRAAGAEDREAAVR